MKPARGTPAKVERRPVLLARLKRLIRELDATIAAIEGTRRDPAPRPKPILVH